MEIVIIGAGPVGLWTAIQTKLQCTNIHVIVYEKHREYQRSHVVSVNPECFIDCKYNADLYICLERVLHKSTINIKCLEIEFKQVAEKLGIQFVYKAVTDIRDLHKSHPTASLIICADGAKSKCREQVFGNEYLFNEQLLYACEVAYTTENKTRKLKPILEAYPTWKLTSCIVHEYIQLQSSQSSQSGSKVTLRFLVDSVTFASIKHATFKNPIHLSKLPAHLLNNINTWMKIRHKCTGEIVTGEISVSSFMLGAFASKKCFQHINDKCTVVLVGDACCGVPFFRSLNNGLMCATKLSICIQNYTENEQNHAIILCSFKSYERYVWIGSLIEKLVAVLHAVVVWLLTFWIKISAIVPWQINRWSAQ